MYAFKLPLALIPILSFFLVLVDECNCTYNQNYQRGNGYNDYSSGYTGGQSRSRAPSYASQPPQNPWGPSQSQSTGYPGQQQPQSQSGDYRGNSFQQPTQTYGMGAPNPWGMNTPYMSPQLSQPSSSQGPGQPNSYQPQQIGSSPGGSPYSQSQPLQQTQQQPSGQGGPYQSQQQRNGQQSYQAPQSQNAANGYGQPQFSNPSAAPAPAPASPAPWAAPPGQPPSTNSWNGSQGQPQSGGSPYNSGYQQQPPAQIHAPQASSPFLDDLDYMLDNGSDSWSHVSGGLSSYGSNPGSPSQESIGSFTQVTNASGFPQPERVPTPPPMNLPYRQQPYGHFNDNNSVAQQHAQGGVQPVQEERIEGDNQTPKGKVRLAISQLKALMKKTLKASRMFNQVCQDTHRRYDLGNFSQEISDLLPSPDIPDGAVYRGLLYTLEVMHPQLTHPRSTKMHWGTEGTLQSHFQNGHEIDRKSLAYSNIVDKVYFHIDSITACNLYTKDQSPPPITLDCAFQPLSGFASHRLVPITEEFLKVLSKEKIIEEGTEEYLLIPALYRCAQAVDNPNAVQSRSKPQPVQLKDPLDLVVTKVKFYGKAKPGTMISDFFHYQLFFEGKRVELRDAELINYRIQNAAIVNNVRGA